MYFGQMSKHWHSITIWCWLQNAPSLTINYKRC